MVFDRDEWRCTSCGKAGRLECDHITPLAEGGTDDLANLRTLCRDCHIAITREHTRVHHVAGQREWERLLAQPRTRVRRLLDDG